MKFISLKMRNWRSFQGDHEIEFSTDPERPVTLLLGPNGAGKTALLNAFTWAIYGKFTAVGFDKVDRLVNLAAIDANPSADTFVEILLEHDEDEFKIRRTTNAQRQISNDVDLIITKNGERSVEADIHSILPEPLKDLFFFPAESFSTASVIKGNAGGEGTSFDIGTAIQSLLSGDIYQNASTDLRKAINSSTLRPPQSVHGTEKVESARKEYEQVRSELNAAEERKEELPKLLAEAMKKAADTKQEADRYNPEEIKKWDKERTRLKNKVTEAEKLMSNANSLYVDLARYSHMYFSQFRTEDAIRRLDLAESAGIMPSRIHESVLDKTLEMGRCMLCRSELNEEMKERVSELRNHMGDSQVAICGLEARTMLKQFIVNSNNELDQLRDNVKDLATQLTIDQPSKDANLKILNSVVRSSITVADGIDRQAKKELEDFKSEDAIDQPAHGKSPIELAINAQKRVDTLSGEKERIGDKFKDLERKRDDAFKSYKSKSGKSDDYKQKTSAIEILEEAKGFFDAAKQGIEEFGRKDFEKAINKTYSDLVAKPFVVHVNPDFSIKVQLADSGEEMPLSQSEKVLLLIAFLGAIARLAPRYEEISKQKKQLEHTGNVGTSKKMGFPVVLDSPTSPLDEEYEKDVVDALPDLLPQIIIPVSAKSVDVWERISSRIGKAYVMRLTSMKSSDRKVHWKGKDHVYSIKDLSGNQARTHLIPLE